MVIKRFADIPIVRSAKEVESAISDYGIKPWVEQGAPISDRFWLPGDLERQHHEAIAPRIYVQRYVGRAFPYYRVVLHRHVIVALMAGGEFILELTIKPEGVVLECVSEHVNAGETDHQAAMRGLREEVGIIPDFLWSCGSRRIVGGVMPLFAATVRVPEEWKPPVPHEGETIHLIRIPRECIGNVLPPFLGAAYTVDVTVDAAVGYL